MAKMVRVDEDLYQLIKEYRKETGMPIAEFVRRAVNQKLQDVGKLPSGEKDERTNS